MEIMGRLWAKYQVLKIEYGQVIRPILLLLWAVSLLLAAFTGSFGMVMGVLLFLLLALIEVCHVLLRFWRESRDKGAALADLSGYTRELETLYEDMRGFRHDYINILTTMNAYLEERQYGELERYFHESIMPLGLRMEENRYKLGALKNLLVPEPKSILAAKGAMAQERGVDFTVEVVEPVEALPGDKMEFCRILGIFLDNAIEAAVDCPRPWVRAALVKKCSGELTLVVVNSVAGEVPPVSRLTERDFSTKGQGRGTGLYTVKKMVEGNPGLSLDLSAEGGRFMAALYTRDGVYGSEVRR